MNRYLASGFGMTLGLLASAGRADDIEWRSPKDRTAKPAPATIKNQPAVSIDAPVVAASAPTGVLAASTGSGVTWVRARGQTEEPSPVPSTLPPATGAPTQPAEQVAAPMSGPVSSQPGWLPGQDPWADGAVVTGRAPRVQVSAEYLFWWTRTPGGPALLTTSPPNGANGVPGAVPGSTVLLTPSDLDDNFRHGMRFGAVYWLDDCASYGIDGRIFFTWDRSDRFEANSNQFPNGLFRPVFLANPNVAGGTPVGEFREVVTAPGATAGRFITDSSSRFWGGDINYRDNILCRSGCDWMLRADLLVGFRYLNLEESLTMIEDVTRLAANPFFPDEGAGTRIVNTERFSTENNFYGGQLGTVVEFRRNRMSLDLRGSVALGVTHQRLDISGSQTRTLAPTGQVLTLPGGLLALPGANIGERDRDVFSVVPEIGLNVGYQVTDHLKAFVGYNFLYWSNVIRPGDQIDRVVDVNRIPRFLPAGVTAPPVFPPRPAPLFNDTDFWAQGVNLGLEYRW